MPGPGLLARPFNLFFAGRVDEAEMLLKNRIDAGATLAPLEEVTLGYLSLQRGRFDEAASRFSSGSSGADESGIYADYFRRVFPSGAAR